ncbi:hypothetical protein ACED66_12495 [Vibrio splendidus]|uniref:hypothetical protein n=1 Tax=Vibrio splendidus TaxID=29497 RepID=UPI000D36F4C9|nr:hypothetical protein [Vibrio splendidus]PTO57425.1 hypothetical protein CWN82_14735 [Vibrio splendidus]PTQ05480.1 hypothetical protein CWO28_11925 [Vibrio splendidus]
MSDNSMQQHITASRIANSVLQDKSNKGFFLFVEGVKDLNVYPQFINQSYVKIEPTYGKYKMREVWEILESRNFHNKIAIRDADFIRIRGNYNKDYHSHFFITDAHDSECMIVNSPTFEKVIDSALSIEHSSNIKSKFPDLKFDIKQICYQLGCLKLANKLDNLGLTFKPKNVKDKGLDFSKFIECKTFKYNSDTALIQSVINYSINKVEKGSIKNESEIRCSFDKIVNKKHPLDEVIHGHDLSQVMYLLVRKHFKYNNNLITSGDNVESLWAMSYDSSYFKDTSLYKNIYSLTNSLDIPLFSI